jgi:hypothetical protein
MLVASARAAEPARRSRPGRDEAFKMVVAYLLSNLQERLGLTDEEYLRVLPLVQQRQNHRREMFEGREEALGRLRMLVRRGESGDELEAAIRQLDAVESEGPKQLAADLSAIDAELSVAQQAKYRLLELDVERRVRELARRHLRERGPRGARQPSPDESTGP